MAGTPYNPNDKSGKDQRAALRRRSTTSKPQTKPRARVGGSDNRSIGDFQQTRQGSSFAPTVDNNFMTDRLRDWGNFIGEFGAMGRANPIGGGYGDFLLGANPNDGDLIGTFRDGRPKPGAKAGMRNRVGGGGFGEETAVPGAEMSLADYLKQAMSIIGGGGGGGVNYDPQRNTLRQNASEGDARLEAMYRQLRGSIDADAPVLQQAYQGAIDSTAQNSATAQAQTQGAADAANARNNEVLANLGIQAAAGNQIQEGRDLNSQAAQQIAAQASKGQAAGDRLVSNQATALQHNTNIGNAAGLEGNLQRAANQSRLQALLAEIDMQEQQQNASLGQDDFSQQMSLANQLLDFDRYNQERNDKLQMQAAEMAANQPQQYDPNAFWNYLSKIQGINGVAPLSEDPNTQVRQLDFYRKLYQG